MRPRQKITRRQFLRRGAGVLGAALAVPSIIPASALGRDGMIAPSERITMGFIGVGGQGGGHLLGGAWTYLTGGYAARKDVQVLAVCDVIRERRENAQMRVNRNYAETYGRENYKSCEGYIDFRNLLERPDIDAVLIATPAHWHALMTVMAANAGKDVYCEKPTATTVRESQAMREAVRRNGRIFQAGTQQRSEYHGLFRRASEFVRSGRIGKLTEIYAYRDGGGIAWPTRFGPAMPMPDGLDWDLFLGPAPSIPYDGNLSAHRFDIGELNWGQHHYDIVQWAADADGTGPVELFMEDGVTNYRYANGVTVYGRAHPDETFGIDGGATFVGTEGRITVDRNKMASYPAHIISEPLHPDEVHLYRTESHSGNFLECIRTRRRTICNEDVAHTSSNAMLLGGVEKQVQRPLKWDPKREVFIDDDEANRLLSIAQRSPWQI